MPCVELRLELEVFDTRSLSLKMKIANLFHFDNNNFS